MSLDGLRAWIAEVERKLGTRTRIFLALATIAIGGAGAAIYLAVDAHDKTVSESDLQALQAQLEGQIGGSTEASAVARLREEVEALRGEVEAKGEKAGVPGEEGQPGPTSKGGPGTSGSGASANTEQGSGSTAGEGGEPSSGGAKGAGGKASPGSTATPSSP